MWDPLKALSALWMAALLGFAGLGYAGTAPPTDILKLEREVSLRIAHVRDVGPVEPDKRKTLSQAQELDLRGEKALKAGDFVNAGNDFERAKDLLDQLGL